MRKGEGERKKDGEKSGGKEEVVDEE